jgi:hypothetical protein
MRQFAASGFRLWNLAREAKIIYTFFCGLSLLAIASSLLLYEDLVGPSLSGEHLSRVGAYYADGTTPATPPPVAPRPVDPAAAVGAGPAIALPDDAEPPSAAAPGRPLPGRLTVTMPYRKLVEVTHFHLFTVPVFLLILTHLFMLTAMSPRWKTFYIVGGWATGALHIFAPWGVRYGGPRLSFLFPLSGGGFLFTSLVLCLYPLLVMWKKPPRERG